MKFNYSESQYVQLAKEQFCKIISTVPFVSDELVVREHIIDFEPGKISKYTIVLWIEGSDPDCTDNILGGEFKVHMDFKSENTEEGEELYEKKK